MSGAGGHRIADVDDDPAKSKGEPLRYAVSLIIVLAFLGGIWTRSHYPESAPIYSDEQVRRSLDHSGLPVAGLFEEPVTGLSGFEVSLPGCPSPIAIFPVAAWNTEVAPAAFRYKDGNYDIVYLYNGFSYPESWVSYRLNALRLYYRALSLFGIAQGNQFAYYFKVWIPLGCKGPSPLQLSALRLADK